MMLLTHNTCTYNLPDIFTMTAFVTVVLRLQIYRISGTFDGDFIWQTVDFP